MKKQLPVCALALFLTGACVPPIIPPPPPVYQHTAIVDGYPTTQFYRKICASENGRVVAAGTDLIYSADSGTTWTAFSNLPGQYVGFVALSGDGSTLITTIRGGDVCKSVDGGANWTKIYSDATEVWALCAVDYDGSTIAVEGDSRMILSQDGGDNWQTVLPGAGCDVALSDDGSTIALASSLGACYISSDAGDNWQLQSIPSVQWRDIAMSADGQLIIVCGLDYNESIYRTADGGTHWTEVTGTNLGNWESLAMNWDGSVILASQSSGNIWQSVDQGLTFHKTGQNGNWNAVGLNRAGSVYFAGMGNGYLHRSLDNGTTWTTLDTPPGQRQWTSAVADRSAQAVLASAYSFEGDYLFHSMDGGQTWTRIDALGKARWRTISCSGDGRIALAAGDPSENDGFLHVSTDWCSTWSMVPQTGIRVWDASAISGDGSVWAAYQPGAEAPNYLFISRDQGATWQQMNVPIITRKLLFNQDGTFLAGYDWNDNKVYVSTNGGLTWTPSSPTGYWRAFAMAGDGTHLALGPDGGDYLYLSSNKGATWAPATALGEVRVGACALDYTARTIVVGGFGGINNTAYLSSDSGNTWIDLAVPPEINYNAAVCADNAGSFLLFSGKIHRWVKQ